MVLTPLWDDLCSAERKPSDIVVNWHLQFRFHLSKNYRWKLQNVMCPIVRGSTLGREEAVRHCRKLAPSFKQLPSEFFIIFISNGKKFFVKSYCHMPFHMEWQMIWPGECTFTQPTLKWSITGVFPIVSCQFVTSWKFPTASLPAANVWFFSRVRPLMGFHMTWFGISLVTTFLRTMVNNLLPGFWPCFSFSCFDYFTCYGKEKGRTFLGFVIWQPLG